MLLPTLYLPKTHLSSKEDVMERCNFWSWIFFDMFTVASSLHASIFPVSQVFQCSRRFQLNSKDAELDRQDTVGSNNIFVIGNDGKVHFLWSTMVISLFGSFESTTRRGKAALCTFVASALMQAWYWAMIMNSPSRNPWRTTFNMSPLYLSSIGSRGDKFSDSLLIFLEQKPKEHKDSD